MHPTCEACRYSWWPEGKPVIMDDSERLLSNGGMGECRQHPPEVPLDRSRHFPLVMPGDWCGGFLANMEETIPVPRSQLMQLLELAEDDLFTRYSEFNKDPTDEDRTLMLSLYRLVGKEVPEFFSRTYGWEDPSIK